MVFRRKRRGWERSLELGERCRREDRPLGVQEKGFKKVEKTLLPAIWIKGFFTEIIFGMS